jgi:hypothetical protein
MSQDVKGTGMKSKHVPVGNTIKFWNSDDWGAKSYQYWQNTSVKESGARRLILYALAVTCKNLWLQYKREFVGTLVVLVGTTNKNALLWVAKVKWNWFYL